MDEMVHDITSFNLCYVQEVAERQALLKAMTYADGNLSETADLLGITRPNLYTLLNKYLLKF